MKEDYDGAEPAASSYAVSNLLRLAAVAPPDEAQARNSLALVSFKALSHQKAMSVALMLHDWAHWKGESQ